MKYVVAWKNRFGGSAAENEASFARYLEVRSKSLTQTPVPEGSFTILQWVLRVDGQGGFLILEGDDLTGFALNAFIMAPYLEWEVYPVIDAGAALPLLTEGVEFRNSVK
jgi:hypothetical protein